MKFTLKILSLVMIAGISNALVAIAPNFEILNKFEANKGEKRPIWISVTNGGKSKADKAKIDSQGTTKLDLDRFKKAANSIFFGYEGAIVLNKDLPTTLSIWEVDPSQQAKANYNYEFPAGKTLYLTFDAAGLRPQTGPLMGLLGYTEHKYSLADNISANEVIAAKRDSISQNANAQSGQAGDEIQDPATEPKSNYSRQEWIDWYQSGGWTPAQYNKWLPAK